METVILEWQPSPTCRLDELVLPYPRRRWYEQRFCIKMTAKDAPTAARKHFVPKIERFRVARTLGNHSYVRGGSRSEETWLADCLKCITCQPMSYTLSMTL